MGRRDFGGGGLEPVMEESQVEHLGTLSDQEVGAQGSDQVRIKDGRQMDKGQQLCKDIDIGQGQDDDRDDCRADHDRPGRHGLNKGNLG